ncbi:MAG: hypothetical protein AAGG75_02765 [Bacteroidota bacterium]
MRLIILLSLFFFLPQLAFSQSTDREKAVYALFDKPGKIKWLRHYKGRIDDLNDITMTLAYTGKHCRGVMVYLRSKQEFRLEGNIKDGLLSLKEIDPQGEVSGHIKAEITELHIVGEWSNFDYSIGGILDMHQVESEVIVPTYCGNNKWIYHYNGSLLGGDSELILQKESEERLRGILYYKTSQKTYYLQGDLDENNLFVLTIKDEHAQMKGTLTGSLVEAHTLNATFEAPNGQQGLATYKLSEEILVGCVEFADYMSSYDITYPKTQHRRFNDWMDRVTGEWVYACRAYVEEVQQLNPEPAPALRAKVRAYAWSDIELLSEEIISGFMTFSNTWSVGLRGQAFNFDLRSGREITLRDLFVEGFDHSRFLKDYLNENIDKHRLYRDAKYRQWLATAMFPHFTIHREGISFCTNFDATYGQQRITIPFSELSPYLHRSNPVRHLYQ